MKNYIYRFGSKAQLLGGLAIMVFFGVLFLFTTHAVGAAQAAQIQVSSANEIVSKVLCPIIDTLFWILMSISVLMILYGAYTYMRAEDDAEKVKLATKTITYAVVGIAVALLAKATPVVISSIFNISGGNITACTSNTGNGGPGVGE